MDLFEELVTVFCFLGRRPSAPLAQAKAAFFAAASLGQNQPTPNSSAVSAFMKTDYAGDARFQRFYN
jgi:hypothetical protein